MACAGADLADGNFFAPDRASSGRVTAPRLIRQRKTSALRSPSRSRGSSYNGYVPRPSRPASRVIGSPLEGHLAVDENALRSGVHLLVNHEELTYQDRGIDSKLHDHDEVALFGRGSRAVP